MKNTVYKNILITGVPGCGKTTLIKKLFEKFSHLTPVGFYTEEIREKGIRKGFKVISSNKDEFILAHVDIKSPYRIGKYGVDVKRFEEFLKSFIIYNSVNLCIIDEIGKMECLTPLFPPFVKKFLDSSCLTVATVALKGEGFIKEVKERKDVKLFYLNEDNRDKVFLEISEIC